MILDRIENLDTYFAGKPRFEKIVPALQKYMAAPFKDGKLEIIPDEVWGNVQTYDTKPLSAGKYEAHREYCDVQVMIRGEEKIGWAPLSACTVTEPFSAEKGDIAFFTCEDGQLLKLRAGQFMVFFPQDAHAPCLESGKSANVTKIVFKVLL